tara:strand:+ start:230 stop:439 length:210 start_codon:yes stop_codon:yes gene_type:complete
MNIIGAITGVFMLFVPVSSEVALTKNVYNGAVLIDKIITKTEEGTWGASAHEEGYQILKDTILKIGGLK